MSSAIDHLGCHLNACLSVSLGQKKFAPVIFLRSQPFHRDTTNGVLQLRYDLMSQYVTNGSGKERLLSEMLESISRQVNEETKLDLKFLNTTKGNSFGGQNDFVPIPVIEVPYRKLILLHSARPPDFLIPGLIEKYKKREILWKETEEKCRRWRNEASVYNSESSSSSSSDSNGHGKKKKITQNQKIEGSIFYGILDSMLYSTDNLIKVFFAFCVVGSIFYLVRYL